jgi:hypothetical protein
VTLPVYLILRTLFLRDAVGFRYGSNGSWGYRLLQNLGGPVTESIALQRWFPLAMALFLVGITLLYLWRRRQLALSSRTRSFSLIGATVAFLGVATFGYYQTSGILNPAAGLFLLMEPNITWQTRACCLFLFAVGAAFYQRTRLAVFLYLWVLLSLGLTLFSPSVMHRYYLVNAAYVLLLAAGLALLLRFVVEGTRSRLVPLLQRFQAPRQRTT